MLASDILTQLYLVILYHFRRGNYKLGQEILQSVIDRKKKGGKLNHNILYYNHSSNATVVTVALNGNKIKTLQSLVTLANNCARDNTNQDFIIQFTRLRNSM